MQDQRHGTFRHGLTHGFDAESIGHLQHKSTTPRFETSSLPTWCFPGCLFSSAPPPVQVVIRTQGGLQCIGRKGITGCNARLTTIKRRCNFSALYVGFARIVTEAEPKTVLRFCLVCDILVTVFSEVHSQGSHLPGNIWALHPSFCWQVLWRCW